MIIDYYKKTWHRVILEKLLKENSSLVKNEILDIGSKNRRYDHLFSGQITAIDKISNPHLNVAPGDIQAGLNLKDNYFNSLICLEVFEYLNELEQPLSEIHRLLKPNGHALITIPFLYHAHQDNIRYTKEFIEPKLKNFSSVEIIKIGNAYTVIWDIIRKKIFGNKKSLFKKFLFLFLLPFLFFIKIFRLDKIEDQYYSGLFIILKK